MKSGLPTIPLNTYFELYTDTQTRVIHMEAHQEKMSAWRQKVFLFWKSHRQVEQTALEAQIAIDQKTLNGFKRALDRMRKIDMDFFMDH